MPATLTNKNRYYKTSVKPKNYTQSVCIAMGAVMILLGLSGILNPEFMGLHLSAMHCLVLNGAGALSIWGATTDDPIKAYYVNIALGIFFALNALAGFFLGEPGHPQVGYDAPDELLLRIAPGFLELGTLDHIVHTFLALFFITGAFSWKRHHRQKHHTFHT